MELHVPFNTLVKENFHRKQSIHWIGVLGAALLIGVFGFGCGAVAPEEEIEMIEIDDDVPVVLDSFLDVRPVVEAENMSGQMAPLTALHASDVQVKKSALIQASTANDIVAIAVHEENRGPDEVGEDLTVYPYKLNNYLKKDEAWCSEFVSWVYRIANDPFTGGSVGGWMLKGSRSIKSWFILHRTFVGRTSALWSTFAPAPGDYIRYNNSFGGHSGIVRYVLGNTLYTVEGNVGNRVRLRAIKNWRDREDIDGFGSRGEIPKFKSLP